MSAPEINLETGDPRAGRGYWIRLIPVVGTGLAGLGLAPVFGAPISVLVLTLIFLVLGLLVGWVELRAKLTRTAIGLGKVRAELEGESRETALILSAMPNLILEASSSGRITRVLKTGYNYKTFRPSHLVGAPVHKFTPAMAPEETRALIHKTLETGEPEEIRIPTFLDRERWLQIRINPLRPDAVLLIIHDVTEVKDSQKDYQELIDLVDCIIIRIDGNKRVTYLNRYAEDFFGRSREEMLGRPALETILKDPPPHWGGEAGEMEESPGHFSGLVLEGQTKDGRQVFVSYSVRLLRQNDPAGGELWVGIDATEQKRVQTEMSRRERYYCSLIENSSDLITVLNRDGKIVFESPAAENWLGFASAETAGGAFMEHIHPEDCKGLESFLSGVESPAVQAKRYEFRRRNKSGAWVPFETTVTNLISDSAVNGLVLNSRNISERKDFEEEIQRRAFYDQLTGLPNRALFIDRLRHTIERSRRKNEWSYAVLFIDVDRFKMINDSLGHSLGDQLLSGIAHTLEARFRRVDTVARFGSDEFVILLDDNEDELAPIRVAERIIEEFKSPFFIEGREVFISVSIGIVFGEEKYEDPMTVVRDADTAMHQAKREEKGRYRIFHARMHRQVRKMLDLENDLRRAIERGEFTVFYQPILKMDTGETTALEALIRWRRPDGGLVPPLEFIPVAEETGLILPIGDWVLRQACREIGRIVTKNGWSDLELNVNLSACQFTQANLAESVVEILNETGFSPNRLKLEVTESALMQKGEQASRICGSLKDHGLLLAIDDFGTGYSSLSYLNQYPFDTLKIDRSFVSRLGPTQDRHLNIIKTIITLAGALRMNVVAEGVETEIQKSVLLDLNCRVGQGYHFAAPMDLEALIEFLGLGPETMVAEGRRRA